MTVEKLEARIAELRSRPLLVLARTPKGKVQQMTVRECVESGSAFISVTVDDLDALLSAELENPRGQTAARGKKKGEN